MQLQLRMRVSAQDGTTVTLVPKTGVDSKAGALASGITQMVITMAARDSQVFDVTNREFTFELSSK